MPSADIPISSSEFYKKQNRGIGMEVMKCNECNCEYDIILYRDNIVCDFCGHYQSLHEEDTYNEYKE